MARRIDHGNGWAIGGLVLLTLLAASHVAALRALALPLLLLLPGASIRAALLRQPVLGMTAESVAVSFVLSLAAVIGCGLGLGAIGVRLSAASVVAAIDAVTLLALWRAPARGAVLVWPAVARASLLLALVVGAAVAILLLRAALPGAAPDPYLDAYLRTEAIELGGPAHAGPAQVALVLENRTARRQQVSISAPAQASLSQVVDVPAGRTVEPLVLLALTRGNCGRSVEIALRRSRAALPFASFSVPVECSP
jgi:hypothetical protein